jgi:hypothetical protein
MDIEKALAEIGEIRHRLSAQSRFQGLGPVAVALTGIMSFVTGVALQQFPHTLAASAAHYALTWMLVAMVGAALIGVHVLLRSRSIHGCDSGLMLNRIFEQLMPAVFVAIVVTAVFFRSMPHWLGALPGIWLLLASLSLFAATDSLGRRIRWVGMWYFVAGAIALSIGVEQPDLTPSPWLLALPFTVGQLALAVVVAVESRDIRLVNNAD